MNPEVITKSRSSNNMHTESNPQLLTIKFAFIISPRQQRPSLEDNSSSANQNIFPAIYKNRKFITPFTTACPYPEPDQFSPHPTIPLYETPF